MYIHKINNGFEIARIYPHVGADSNLRHIASSVYFRALRDGTIRLGGVNVTVESISREAAEMILAVMEAAKIAKGEN